MGISINTNIAASRASHFLASNHANLQKSLDRLSSGRRITEPADDAGGLAVAMKLNHSIQGLSGASKNIGNAISFLQVQDGILASAGDIVSRMGELKGLYGDVLKSTSDKATYDAEFNDLRDQLYSLTQTQFNGIYLFGDWNQATDALSTLTAPTELDIYITENGSSGSSVKIDRAVLGAELNVNAAGAAAGALDGAAGLAAPSGNDLTLADANFTADAFTNAVANVAKLRAANGGQVSRLQYAQADVDSKMTNMAAAHGRIMDVDIAAESSNLAKQQILVQASAAMTAQANSANDVALLLLQ
jgi:flagellin